jgi:hypothetical protein
MKFIELYESYWKEFINFKNNHENLSNPLLLNYSIGYEDQETKLFIIGQQTQSWYDNIIIDDTRKSILGLMKIYVNEFRLGLSGPFSPFWKAARVLEDELNINSGSIMWSNLNKVDQDAKRPSEEIESKILDIFPVLKKEIRLATPDIILFFTGPFFDGHIERIFQGVRFKAVEGHEERKFARLIHTDLPQKSFRTYHPNFLQRQGLTNEVLDLILNLVK